MRLDAAQVADFTDREIAFGRYGWEAFSIEINAVGEKAPRYSKKGLCATPSAPLAGPAVARRKKLGTSGWVGVDYAGALICSLSL